MIFFAKATAAADRQSLFPPYYILSAHLHSFCLVIIKQDMKLDQANIHGSLEGYTVKASMCLSCTLPQNKSKCVFIL